VKEKTSVNMLVLLRVKQWKLRSAQVTVVTGVAGMNGPNAIIHVTKVLELDHVNAIAHQVLQSTSVHVLANPTSQNHVTFHRVKTSAILESGAAGLTVILNVDRDSRLEFEHVIVKLVLNAPSQLRNLANVQKRNKLNVPQNQHATGHRGVTGPTVVVIVATRVGPVPESVIVVTSPNAKQKNRIAPETI